VDVLDLGLVHQGFVEVNVSGQWRRVCGLDWGLDEADTVCMQLGYTYGAVEVWYPLTPELVSMDDDLVDIFGVSDLAGCGNVNHDCTEENGQQITAGVICHQHALGTTTTS